MGEWSGWSGWDVEHGCDGKSHPLNMNTPGRNHGVVLDLFGFGIFTGDFIAGKDSDDS